MFLFGAITGSTRRPRRCPSSASAAARQTSRWTCVEFSTEGGGSPRAREEFDNPLCSTESVAWQRTLWFLGFRHATHIHLGTAAGLREGRKRRESNSLFIFFSFLPLNAFSCLGETNQSKVPVLPPALGERLNHCYLVKRMECAF